MAGQLFPYLEVQRPPAVGKAARDPQPGQTGDGAHSIKSKQPHLVSRGL